MLVPANRQAATRQLSDRFGLSESQVLTNPNILFSAGDQMVADPRCRHQELSTSSILVPEHMMGPLAPVAEQVAQT